MVQEVHLGKSSPAMEADLRKCGADIKRGLRQSVDRTHRSPRQQIQCGGGWRVNKSTTQKSCSPSHHRGPRYSTASCGAASRFCRVRRACSSGRHGAAQEFTLTEPHSALELIRAAPIARNPCPGRGLALTATWPYSRRAPRSDTRFRCARLRQS